MSGGGLDKGGGKYIRGHSLLYVHSASRDKYIVPRDAKTIGSLHDLSIEDQKSFLSNSSLLNPGNTTRSKEALISAAINTGEQWLTDICCPTVEASILLHIAKELIVNYKIDLAGSYDIAAAIYKKIQDDNMGSNLFIQIKTEMDHVVLHEITEAEVNNRLNINNASLKKKGKTLINVDDKNVRRQCKDNLLDMQKSKRLNEITATLLSKYLDANYQKLALQKKPLNTLAKNHHYLFLGPPASGKSTLAKMESLQTQDMVLIKTDDYRPFSDLFSSLQREDTQKKMRQADEKLRQTRGVATQDIAFLVKSLVVGNLQRRLESNTPIPNILFDGVNLDASVSSVLSYGSPAVTSSLAYFGGLHDDSIATRAHNRAINEQSDPGDKHRYVHTDTLLSQHSQTSQDLFRYVPSFCETIIYNTDVNMGDKAEIIAKVDPEKSMVQVFNFIHFSDFLCKANLNITASSALEQLLNPNRAMGNKENSALITNIEARVEVLLNFVRDAKSDRDVFTIGFFKENVEYARLKRSNGKIELELMMPECIMQKTIQSSIVYS